VMIEDVNEPAYRLDRLLVHLHNAGLWQNASAIVLGDFACHQSLAEAQKIERVLQAFSDGQSVPVFSLPHFGHGPRNQPIPLGVDASIEAQGQVFCLRFVP
jgi:muramoyltetrapeptide carboxypeptidase